MMTALQKDIVLLMKQIGISKDACITIMSNIRTEKQQKEMLIFLQENPTATNRQAVIQAKKFISDK